MKYFTKYKLLSQSKTSETPKALVAALAKLIYDNIIFIINENA